MRSRYTFVVAFLVGLLGCTAFYLLFTQGDSDTPQAAAPVEKRSEMEASRSALPPARSSSDGKSEADSRLEVVGGDEAPKSAAPTIGTDVVQFVFSNGVAASHLRLASPFALVIGNNVDFKFNQPVDWRIVTDRHGRVPLASLRAIGPIAVARLNDSAIALISTEFVEGGSTFELPGATRVLIRFATDGPDTTLFEGKFVFGLGTWKNYSTRPVLAELRRDREAPWVDLHAVQVGIRGGQPEAPIRLISAKTVSMEATSSQATLVLTEGEYRFSVLESPFGLWVDPQALMVSGTSMEVVLSLRMTPLVNLPVRLGSDGEPINVQRVAHYVRFAPAVGAPGSYEQDLPWEVHGHHLWVSVIQRALDEPGVIYAIRVYWEDGHMDETEPHSYEGLSGTMSFR